MPVLPGGEGTRQTPNVTPAPHRGVPHPVHSQRLFQHGHRGILGGFQLSLATLGAGLRVPQQQVLTGELLLTNDSTQGKQHWRHWEHPPQMGDKGTPHSFWADLESQNLTGLMCGKCMETGWSKDLAPPGLCWCSGLPQHPQPTHRCGQQPEQAELSEGTIPPKTPVRGMRI